MRGRFANIRTAGRVDCRAKIQGVISPDSVTHASVARIDEHRRTGLGRIRQGSSTIDVGHVDHGGSKRAGRIVERIVNTNDLNGLVRTGAALSAVVSDKIRANGACRRRAIHVCRSEAFIAALVCGRGIRIQHLREDWSSPGVPATGVDAFVDDAHAGINIHVVAEATLARGDVNGFLIDCQAHLAGIRVGPADVQQVLPSLDVPGTRRA